jgi:hypothetical protein
MNWAAVELFSQFVKQPEPRTQTDITTHAVDRSFAVAHFRHISSQPKWMRWPRQSLTLAVLSSSIAFWALTFFVASVF